MLLHVATIALVCSMPLQPFRDSWHLSPEALFLSPNELRVWQTLSSDPERERFKAEYWRRRDTDPATSSNEFQRLIRARIERADREFGVSGTPGSQTDRGRAFVLLGPAAVEKIVQGPLDGAPRLEGGQLVFPRGLQHTRQWHAWVYDRDKNRDLVDLLRRPHVELTFIVDPGVGDALQNQPLFARIREKVARASIVDRKMSPLQECGMDGRPHGVGVHATE